MREVIGNKMSESRCLLESCGLFEKNKYLVNHKVYFILKQRLFFKNKLLSLVIISFLWPEGPKSLLCTRTRNFSQQSWNDSPSSSIKTAYHLRVISLIIHTNKLYSPSKTIITGKPGHICSTNQQKMPYRLLHIPIMS